MPPSTYLIIGNDYLAKGFDMLQKSVRLNKYIASLGFASRREADRWIQSGLIKINGQIATNPAERVDPNTVKIEISDKIKQIIKERITIKIHKPSGVVVSNQKSEGTTIFQLMEAVGAPEGLFPVGRIDKDSSGLILMTNDPTLTTRIIGENSHIEKEYFVKTIKPIEDGALQKMREGMNMMGTRTLKARVIRAGASAFRIILTEGKNRQIRRMCRKVGHQVKLLKRIRIGQISLGNLKAAQWSQLSPEEQTWLNTLAEGTKKWT